MQPSLFASAAPPSGVDRDPRVLDNVVWSALAGPHASLAEGSDRARRYRQAIAPFAAMPVVDDASMASLAELVQAGQSVALVTLDELVACKGLERVMHTLLEQMVLADSPVIAQQAAPAIERLTTADVPEMLALTAATRPGPFGPRTIELGAYYGIRSQGGALVAMAGERMRAPGYTEVSAICVAEKSRGLGHAAALTRHVAGQILERSETPFLHVLATNRSAIALYVKLGFRLRRQLHLASFASMQSGSS